MQIALCWVPYRQTQGSKSKTATGTHTCIRHWSYSRLVGGSWLGEEGTGPGSVAGGDD